MSVCIIKYNAGNCASVANALARLGVKAVISDEPAVIRSAPRVIFPGVGEAASAMAYLQQRGLDIVIRGLEKPFLGICLGLQLLCRHSEERNTPCIGVFPNTVRRFSPVAGAHAVKVPHMGWNTAGATQGNALLPSDVVRHYYFLHSYYADLGPDTVATATHGVAFSAALVRDNFHAVQFHPEKSGAAGAAVLERFLAL